jgi:glycolate oxidase FAD binding subunit
VQALLDSLRGTVGPAHVLTGVELSPFVVEGRTPDAAVFPGTIDEVATVVRHAAAAGAAIMAWGGGTAVALGEPPRSGLVVGLRRLARLVEHEPGDLTATVEAGLTLDALQTALRARGQWLSLDPPDAARATLGGIVAADASGARRHLYGTVRDLLIGLTVVTADGAVVRGGGKVVKNVAGYDLPKLFIGSWGTLGIVVEATFKLRPLPDDERLLAVRFDRLKDVASAARAVLASDLIPNAVEVVDPAAAAVLGLAGEPALVVGFDGLREQVDWQVAELTTLVGPLGGRDVTVLSPAAWSRLPTLARDAIDAPAAVMTLSILPSVVADAMEQGAQAARQHGLASAWAAHAGVGAITAALQAGREPSTVAAVLTQWRAIARAGGGHATLAWAPLAVKAQVPVWDDAGAAGRIMQRIKAQLDPGNVLNPGRFVAGI